MAGYMPYPEYKDSGVEWLGNVPRHWAVRKLKFFITAYGGGTPNTSKAEYWGGDIPWVSPKDMKFELIRKTEDYLTELGVNESSTQLVPVDAVLVVVRSGILRHTIPVARNSVVVALNQDMKALVPNMQLSSSFLHRFIQGNQNSLLPLWSKPGCTVESIEYGYMANTEIAAPPRNEQQAIARFLDHKTAQIDALIAKKEELLEKIAEKRTALISHAVTKGFDPNVKMKDSGVEWLGEVPDHWDVKKLKFFVTAHGGGTPNTGKPEYWGGDIPWVSPKDMKSELITETEDYLTELGVNESSTQCVPVDSVLIVVRSGILRHTIPVARNSVVVSLNQDMKALIPNNKLMASFLHRLIQGNQQGLLPLWSKPGCTVESIEYSYMANTEIGVPPIKEQQVIVEYIDTALIKLDRQSVKAQQAIEKLKEYRSALITQAVTGKIDARNIGIPETITKGEAA
jgi:type I restriction enzyme S subunit